MDFDRTSLSGSRAQDLRPRTAMVQERPEHGGPVAIASTEHRPRRDEGKSRERRTPMATVVEFLSLPGDTEVDIEVDVRSEQVTFRVRDRQTGALVHEVPETDAETLLGLLRECHGALVDRSL